jgi:hypothetical protein
MADNRSDDKSHVVHVRASTTEIHIEAVQRTIPVLLCHPSGETEHRLLQITRKGRAALI